MDSVRFNNQLNSAPPLLAKPLDSEDKFGRDYVGAAQERRASQRLERDYVWANNPGRAHSEKGTKE
jgi:hypothetical protein